MKVCPRCLDPKCLHGMNRAIKCRAKFDQRSKPPVLNPDREDDTVFGSANQGAFSPIPDPTPDTGPSFTSGGGGDFSGGGGGDDW